MATWTMASASRPVSATETSSVSPRSGRHRHPLSALRCATAVTAVAALGQGARAQRPPLEKCAVIP